MKRMKRNLLRILFLPLLLLCVVCSWAAPVTPQQAQVAAMRFCKNRLKAPGKGQLPPLRLVMTRSIGKKSNAFYVFSRGTNGYIIIAGDDRVPTVLGYSDGHAFDAERIPDNMQAWLDGYARQISFITSHPKLQNRTTVAGTGKEVEALLGDINWDQGNPYNAICPDNCPVGCAAISMSQVMYYHRWPEKGIGTKTYTTQTNKYKLSADFGNTTYAWSDMLPTLTPTSSQKAIKAVSTLCYQVGVAIDMDYTSNGSGALATPMPIALINNFGYDKGCTLLMRDYFTANDWQQLLRDELDNQRPVIYNGYTSLGEGHSFVCDGYNADGYYHINWGWNGEENGYFLLSALDPENMGVGGSASKMGFDYNQLMIIGIQKPTANSHKNYFVNMETVGTLDTLVAKKDTVRLCAKEVYNDSNDTIDVSFRFDVYDTLHNVVAASVARHGKLSPGHGYDEIERAIALPSTMKDGSYEARLAFKVIGQDTAYKKAYTKVGEDSYYTLTVKGDSVRYLTAGKPVITVKDVAIDGDTIVSEQPYKLRLKLHNSGGEFNGNVYFTLNYPGHEESYETTFSNTKQVTLKAGEDTEVVFEENMKLAGNDKYRLRFYLEKDGVRRQIGMTDTIPVKGRALDPQLDVIKYVEFTSGNDNVKKENMDFVAVIANNGGDYHGRMTCRIVNGNDVLATLDTVDVFIPADSTKEVHITGKFMDAEDGMTYQAELYDVTAGGWLMPIEKTYCDFTICEDNSELSPRLYLKKQIEMEGGNNAVDWNNICLNAKVQNTGGYYKGFFVARIYNKHGHKPIALLDTLQVEMEAGQTKTFTLKGKADLVPEHIYTIELCHDGGKYDNWLSYDKYYHYSYTDFTVAQTSGIYNIDSDAQATGRLDVFSLRGELVLSKQHAEIGDALNTLPTGIYIVRTTSGTDTKIRKVVKQ